MAVEKLERQYRIHWNAVLAGAFTALGVWMFLYTLGGAIGGAGGKAGPTTWTAVYTLIAPIIAFFFGGYVVARDRGIDTKGDGALHAVVTWGFGMVIGTLLLSITGAEILIHTRSRVNIPDGYLWAVAGSILGSLITAVLGAMTAPEHEHAATRADIVTSRREVHA